MKEKKYEMFERRTNEIIKEYSIKLTVRQVYYRLVVSQDIENNRSQYNYFDKILTKLRQKDLKLANYFEDKTRKLINEIKQDSFQCENIKDLIESKINELPYYYYYNNNFQENITIIFLEKQALESVFMEALKNKSGYILCVSRGLNSFSQMNDLRILINNNQNNRKLNLYIFRDYDDSGILITKNFLFQCKEYLGITFNSINEIALNKKQIEQYNIPKNPNKRKGKKSTHTIHLEKTNENLNFFVELDALEPNILISMVKQCIDKNFNYKIYKQMKKVEKIRNRRVKKQYIRTLKNYDYSKIN